MHDLGGDRAEQQPGRCAHAACAHDDGVATLFGRAGGDLVARMPDADVAGAGETGSAHHRIRLLEQGEDVYKRQTLACVRATC